MTLVHYHLLIDSGQEMQSGSHDKENSYSSELLVIKENENNLPLYK